MRKTSIPFKPRARLLLELGNQLIKDEGIALFELVKNSYDADATESMVFLKNIDASEKGEITIIDDGSGMEWEIIRNVWLEPGTDYRENQVMGGKRTKKFHRTPMGQKGIGRFGAHKLGKKIQLITRSKDNNEIVVNIDWTDFTKKKYLADVPVDIYERKPQIFTGKKTGTQLRISELWNTWDRGMVRNVYRAINSVCSPFNSPDSFKAVLDLKDEDKKDWLEGLMSWKTARKAKLFTATCYLEDNKLTYIYNFIPWKTMTKVNGRKLNLKNKQIKMIDEDKKSIDLGKYNIGRVKIDLDIYDLDSNILALGINDKKGLKDFLRFNGGVRVYRDGIRVYDYGELGNDWLELGVRRVNLPTKRLSNNIIIGAVSISRDSSTDLQEKTNREGFIENEAVKIFRKAILYALTNIEAERNKDKERLRIAYSKTSYREPVVDVIADLRVKFEKKGLIKELGGYLDRIEKDYKDVKEKLLSSAGAGLSLSIVVHEIEKIISELSIAAKKDKATNHIKDLTKRLSELVEGYAALVRRGRPAKIKASELIEQALFNVNYRLSVHKVELINGCTKENDFVIKCSKRLILGAIMNIIDNSLWWLENKRPEKKQIYISATKDLSGGPAIVIGDNGPGFMDSVEDVILPFFTRKPDGMGLGLHITDEIMRAHGGKFTIPDKGDVKLPKGIDGAVIALIFKGD
jgi:signal transduction histidine kinase